MDADIRSAMADLLDDDFRLAAIDTLYRCHVLLLDYCEALFTHLKDRWSGLFGASYDILLYDLTSTYFEVDANGPITEASKLRAFGYSRDKRPDCVQIVIALIITPDGLPIGYEVMRGNTSDNNFLLWVCPSVYVVGEIVEIFVVKSPGWKDTGFTRPSIYL
jgi:hypothetical protein